MDKDTINQDLRIVSNELAQYMHENVGRERTPVYMEVEKFGKRIVEKLRAEFKKVAGAFQQPVPVKTAAVEKAEAEVEVAMEKASKKVKKEKVAKPKPGVEVDADTDEFN